MVRGRPCGLLQFSRAKLLRSSLHLFCLADVQGGQTGRDGSLLGQWPRWVVAWCRAWTMAEMGRCLVVRLTSGERNKENMLQVQLKEDGGRGTAQNESGWKQIVGVTGNKFKNNATSI